MAHAGGCAKHPLSNVAIISQADYESSISGIAGRARANKATCQYRPETFSLLQDSQPIKARYSQSKTTLVGKPALARTLVGYCRDFLPTDVLDRLCKRHSIPYLRFMQGN